MKLVLEYTLKMGNGSNKHTTSANGQAQSLELIKYLLRHFVYHRRDSAFPYSFVLWQPNGPYCKCELCVNHPNISYIWPEHIDMMTFAIFIRQNHTQYVLRFGRWQELQPITETQQLATKGQYVKSNQMRNRNGWAAWSVAECNISLTLSLSPIRGRYSFLFT